MANLNQATNTFLDLTRKAQASIAGNAALQNEIGNKIVDDATKQGDISARITGLEGVAALQVQADKAKAAQSFGADLNAQNELLPALSRQALESQQKAASLADEAGKLQSVSMLDNPVQYILNAFKLDAVLPQLDTERKKSEIFNSEIEHRQAQASNQSKIQADIAATLTPEKVKLLQERDAVVAAQAANKARLDTVATNSQNTLAAVNLGKGQLDALYSLDSAKRQAAQLQISQEHLALSKENAAEQRREFEMRMKLSEMQFNEGKRARDEKNAEDLQMESIMKTGQAILGQIPMEGPSLRIAIKDALTKGEKSMHYQAHLQGTRASIAGKTSFGDSPGDFLEMATSPGFVRVVDAKKPVANLITDGAVPSVIKQTKDPKSPYFGLDPRKDPDGFKKAVSDETRKLVISQQAKIIPGSGNLFDIGSLSDVIKNNPSLGELSVVKSLLAERIAAGDKLNDPAQIFAAASKAFSEGKLTTEQIGELSALYKSGAQVNAQVKDFDAFGIHIIPADVKYRVEIETKPNALFGKKEVIDLTDTAALKKAIVSSASNKYVNIKRDNQVPWAPFN